MDLLESSVSRMWRGLTLACLEPAALVFSDAGGQGAQRSAVLGHASEEGGGSCGGR